MKKVSALMLCGLLGVATLPAQATDLGNLLGEANREASNLLEGVNSEAAENPITSLLSKGLDINDKQAAGGAGAMLAMAYQTLGESQSSELLKMVPGMESLTGMIPAGLGSNLANLESVDKVFNLLGMDAGMVQKFAPMIIKYLTGEGASESLLSGLTSAWGVK
ncbi:DUF2780 domain-containing protein [Enterovibrio paralichthyis]|uniref:DUF2780 domain-containing protein n=1 Tax=Enterovibrio paralichthyis TaxID=2853805 RepID=UPI001C46631B|nr:DUF2780 domain-containing protein [Enterovibrio paralichthyis]MBV7300414.1 DUF2780 domain-containing protein [Enterovibrio paralichthyis]